MTKLNLELDRQNKQSNLIVNGIRIIIWCNLLGVTMKMFEPLPCPVVRVFITCLVKEMESMLFLERSSSVVGNPITLKLKLVLVSVSTSISLFTFQKSEITCHHFQHINYLIEFHWDTFEYLSPMGYPLEDHNLITYSKLLWNNM